MRVADSPVALNAGNAANAFDDAEEAAAVTVSPRSHCDALGRVLRTNLPDGTYTKIEWDGWQ